MTAQATYYVPRQTGSHDLKVGFEYLLDIAKYTIDGRSGPIRYRDLNGATDQIRFVDVGKNGDLGATWRGQTIATSVTPATRRTAGTRTTGRPITAGLRWDYQRPYYLDGKRDPIIKDVLTSVRSWRRSPASRCSRRRRRPARRHLHAQLVRAAPRRQLRRHRQGQHGPQGLLRPLLLQLRRCVQHVEPGRSELQDVQVQRSERQQDLRRSAGARRLRQLGGWHHDQGRSEHEEAVRGRVRRCRSNASSGASRRCAWPMSGRRRTTSSRRSMWRA